MHPPPNSDTGHSSSGREWFRRFAYASAHAMGSPWAFLVAFASILGWVATGPVLGFSETWQLTVNTVTTVITFLMVFLIQNAQNREARVMELKLDELIRALEPARNRLVRMDEMSDAELERIESEFHDLHARASRLREARATGRDSGKRARP